MMITQQGRTLRPRENSENPYSPICKRHLARSCGTCRRYSGGLDADGVCGLDQVARRRGTSAVRCPDWARKIAGIDV